MPKINYNPEKDIPDLSGKVILVTGGTAGVGEKTIQYLLPHNPSHIIFTGRNRSAGETLAKQSQADYPDVRVTFIPCDLSSLASVKAAAATVLSTVDRLDIFLGIAGIMANPPGLSTDGYEIQFATNHLGHAMLLRQLLPLLQRTANLPGADVRISLTTSTGAALTPPGGIVFKDLKTKQSMFFGTWRRYGQSKLANILYARSLAKHYPEILVTSVHPGVALTDLLRSLSLFDKLFIWFMAIWVMQPAHELAWNGLWATVGERKAVQNGAYYEPVGVKPAVKDYRKDEVLAERLWEWTERELEKWD